MSRVQFSHTESAIEQPKLTMLDGSGPASAAGATNPRVEGVTVQGAGSGPRARMQPKLTSFEAAAGVSPEMGGVAPMADLPAPVERARATAPVLHMLPSSEPEQVHVVAPTASVVPAEPARVASAVSDLAVADDDDDDLDDDLDEDDDEEDDQIEAFDPDLATPTVLREKILALPTCTLDAVALKKRTRPQLASLYRKLVSQST